MTNGPFPLAVLLNHLCAFSTSEQKRQQQIEQHHQAAKPSKQTSVVKWTSEENKVLEGLVAQIGEGVWATLSEQMVWLGYSRDASQCEERWYEIQAAALSSRGPSGTVVTASAPVEF